MIQVLALTVTLTMAGAKQDLVGDGTKTPTEDDTINQKQAETYNQKSQRS